MNKIDLLKTAALHYTLTPFSRAYKFAERSWADAEIEAVRQHARHRAKLIDRIHAYLCWAAFIGCVVGASVLEMAGVSAFERVLLAVGGGFGCCIVVSIFHAIIEAVTGCRKIADLLTPVAGTSECHTGLNLLKEGGPNVTAWRDAVLQERSQLYSFDLEVMRALHWLHYEDSTAERKRVEQENACRELHGVATEVSAN